MSLIVADFSVCCVPPLKVKRAVWLSTESKKKKNRNRNRKLASHKVHLKPPSLSRKVVELLVSKEIETSSTNWKTQTDMEER